VAPEAIMKLYHCFQRGDVAEARRIQFKVLEIIKTMFAAGNFPEGFREGAALRGFDIGRARQPLSEREKGHLEDIRSKLACLLTECGFPEAAHACRPTVPGVGFERVDIERIVRNVIQDMGTAKN
jgi:4-hydroxy-tetrahydrodipicolinate synthase